MLKAIIEDLKKFKRLEQIVVTIGAANADEFRRAKKFFASLS